MKVFVTRTSGHIASAVTLKLITAGHAVTGLARAGHTVYASMWDTGAEHARVLRRLATDEDIELRTVTLDVQSDASAERRWRSSSRRPTASTSSYTTTATSGTSHFQNASLAGDQERSQGYAALDPFVARNTEATRSLFEPGVDPDPATVAEEITRILPLPHGARPFRSVVDFTRFGIDEIIEPNPPSARP